MSRTQITSGRLAPVTGHYSQAIAVPARGTLVFLSGMTARNRDGGVTGVGDVVAQATQACENLRDVLAEAGGSMDDVVRVDVFVRNMEDFGATHQVRRKFFPGTPPASTIVEVSKFFHKDYLIEINAIAVIPEGEGR